MITDAKRAAERKRLRAYRQRTAPRLKAADRRSFRAQMLAEIRANAAIKAAAHHAEIDEAPGRDVLTHDDREIVERVYATAHTEPDEVR